MSATPTKKLDIGLAFKLAGEGSATDFPKEIAAGMNQVLSQFYGSLDNSIAGDFLRAVKGKPIKSQVEFILNHPNVTQAEKDKIAGEYLNADTLFQKYKGFYDDNADYWLKDRSAKAQAEDQYVNNSTGAIDTFSRYADQPSAAVRGIVRNLPQIAPMLALRKAPVAAQIGLGSAYQGEVGREQAYDQSLQDSQSANAGAGDQFTAANTAGNTGRAVSTAASLIGAKADAAALNLFTGQAQRAANIAGNGIGNILKMPLRQGAEEFVDEAGSPLGANIGAQQTYDPGRDISQGVAAQGAQGAVIGIGMGIPHGIAEAANSHAKQDVSAADQDIADIQQHTADIAELHSLAQQSEAAGTPEGQQQASQLRADAELLDSMRTTKINRLKQAGMSDEQIGSVIQGQSAPVETQAQQQDELGLAGAVNRALSNQVLALPDLSGSAIPNDMAVVSGPDGGTLVRRENLLGAKTTDTIPSNRPDFQVESPARPEQQSIIMRRDGSPFATQQQAEQAIKNRRLSGMHEVQTVDGGFALGQRQQSVDTDALLKGHIQNGTKPNWLEMAQQVGKSSAELSNRYRELLREYKAVTKSDSAPPENLTAATASQDSTTVSAPAEKAPRRLNRTVNPDNDSMLVALAKSGGINRDEAIKHGIDPAMLNHRPVFGQPLFPKTGGMDFDGAAEMLSQDDYPVFEGHDYSDKGLHGGVGRQYSANAFGESLRRALNGEDIGTHNYHVGKAEKARQEADEQARIDALFDAEGSTSSNPDWLDEVVDAYTEELKENPEPSPAITRAINEIEHGQSTEAQDAADNGRQKADASTEEDGAAQSSTEADAASEAGRPESATGTGKAQGRGFELTGQTEDERRKQDAAVLAEKQRQEKQAKAAADKAKADAELSDFRLSGSDRPADTAMAGGQNDLFAPKTRGEKEAEQIHEKTSEASSKDKLSPPAANHEQPSDLEILDKNQNKIADDIVTEILRVEKLKSVARAQGKTSNAKMDRAKIADKWGLNPSPGGLFDVVFGHAVLASIGDVFAGGKPGTPLQMHIAVARYITEAVSKRDAYLGRSDSSRAQAEPVKWFGTLGKANEWVAKMSKINGETYHIVQAGPHRFEVFAGKKQERPEPSSATTETGKQIAKAMEATASAITEASHKQAVARFKKEGGLTYTNPAAVAQVQKDARYKVTINAQGQAVVNAIQDPDTGEWISEKSLKENEQTIAKKISEENTRQQEPKKSRSERKVIGKNYRGETLYEDENGVRSYAVDGILVTEPVTVTPGKGFSRQELTKEYKTTEELNAEKSKALSEDQVFQHRLDVAKLEIEEMIADGTIPPTVTDFSDLHDYIDANELINDAERTDRMIGPLGKQLGWGQQDYINFSNKLIDAIDSWLADRAKAKTPKESLLIKIDDELDSALDDLAAVFKEAGKGLNSGVDPVILGKVLAVGAKASVLYLAKGAVKFLVWAENMLAGLGAKGVPSESIKPYLKQLYLASKVDAPADVRKQMDKEDDVLDYDLSSIGATLKQGGEKSRADATLTQVSGNDTSQVQTDEGHVQQRTAEAEQISVSENEGKRGAGELSGQPDGSNDGKHRSGPESGDSRPVRDRQSNVREERHGTSASDKQSKHGSRGDGTESGNGGSDSVSNYRIQPGELTRTGSWKATAEQNVRIVELVKQIMAEGRQATAEEKALLTKFTGWGASEIANGIFPDQYGRYKDGWQALGERLKSALSPEEYAEARRTTQYAHYTSEPIIRSVYSALERIGFNGGQVLEPGMGVGLFNGLMPDGMASGSTYTGIEYDTITGNIAKLLYPQSNIIVGDFTQTKLPRDFFDGAIGNPPFGQIRITGDSEYKKQGFLLHDYFFAKTIDRVKPGGILVFVTSKGTMDKATDRARKYLGERANLLGAIRLPQTAFKGNAGTEVVTDVLFLQKRGPGISDNGVQWQGLAEVSTAQGPASVNEYFAAHPEMVLGRHAKTGSMYRADEYTVEPIEGNIEDLFAKAVQNLPENIFRPERGSQAEQATVKRRDYDPKVKKEGGIYAADDGVLMQVEEGSGVPLTERLGSNGKLIELKPKEVEWLKGYSVLRDQLKQAQYDQLNNADWESSLKALQKAYADFTKKHGQILAHSVTERENDDGTVTVIRRFKNEPLIRLDAEGALVYALEVINPDGTVSEGAVLKGRILNKPKAAEITSTNDALFVSLNNIGRLDMSDIARLAGKKEDEVIAELGTLVYESPSQGWQMADEYLSGNVVRKLKEAVSAARINKKYSRNVEALKNVQPRALAPADITVQLGSSWIPASDIGNFAGEVLGERMSVSYSRVTGQWSVTGSGRGNVSEWAVKGYTVPELLQDVLANRTIKVTYRDNEGKTHTDAEATERANDVAKKMRQAFKSWIWRDATRTERLAKYYNEHYNNIVAPVYDGKHLTLPGVSSRFKLYQHQKRAIWRIIQQGDNYLAHAVGAGKTFTMIAAAMEERRLGLIQKPMMVVPNHMLAQFSKEFLELYPTANIMVADETNFHTHNRRKFVAQAALNDPDAIVITHSAFGRIGMSPEFVEQFLKDQIYEWKMALEEADKGDRVTIKQIERRIEQLENRMKAVVSDQKDLALTFEQLGVDRLYVDEMHEFRKLDFATNRANVKGIDPNGSMRAMDLMMKVQYLRKANPERAIVGASGTPITNTMGELFTVQRIFQPAQLEEDGLDTFDGWSNQFGEVVDGLEQNAAGGYESVSRFAKFVNVPELMSRVRTFMDILTSSSLGELVQRPVVEGGGRQVIVTPSPTGYKAYQKALEQRIKDIRNRKGPPKPGDDIILSVISDGRFSAIDLRFVDSSMPNDPESKLNRMLDDVIAAYHEGAKKRYQTGGAEDAIPGSSLMIFTDLGLGEQSAKSRGFDMKAWIEKRLIEGGVDRAHIAFMRDHKAHAKKERLFDDMRQGRKRILIGGKDMETGVNAQKRLTDLFHLDAPWFPASVEQREGRIIRQGNQNQKVRIRAYATKGSYDSTMWGMNARKARFIEQALNGDSSVRSMEDVSEASAFEMAAALASGDERYLKLAGLKGDAERLGRLFSAHMSEQRQFRSDKMGTEHSIRNSTQKADQLRAAIKKRQPINAGEFAGKVGNVAYDSREEFSKALFLRFTELAEANTVEEMPIASLGGFDVIYSGVKLRKDEFAADLTMDLPDSPDSLLSYPTDPSLTVGGLATRAVNQVMRLDRTLAETEEEIARNTRKLAQIESRIGAVFAEQSELNEKQEALRELEAELAKESEAVNADATAATIEAESQDKPQLSRASTVIGKHQLSTQQVRDILQQKLSGKGIDIKELEDKGLLEIHDALENIPADALRSMGIYRVDAKDFDYARIKPHGLYVSIPDNPKSFDSPFGDTGDTNFAGYASPEKPLIVKNMQVQHARGKGYPIPASAGVSALAALVDEQEFGTLLKKSKGELRTLISEQYPDIDTSGYHDAYELLEVLGAQKAKEQGYDAIILKEGSDPFNEMVILDNGIIDTLGELEARFSKNGSVIEGFYHKGKVHLIAKNLSPDSVFPVFMHELGGHAGFQQMLKKAAYESLMKQFHALVENGNPVALAAKARAEEAEADQESRDLEYLPYLLTEATANMQANPSQKGAVKRLIEQMVRAIKAWLLEKTGIAWRLTPEDMVSVAERMIRRISTGLPSTQADRDALFSRQPINVTGGASNGISIAQAQKVADAFLRDYNGHIPLEIRVVNKQEDVYGQKGSPEKIGRINGAYHAKSRVVILVASSFSQPHEARTTLRHEILGHYGLNTFSELDRKALLEKIIASRNAPILKGVWARIDKLYDDISEIGRAEEVFAFVAERELSPASAVWNDILNLVYKGLRAIGLVKSPLSNVELNKIARSIAKGIRNGTLQQKTFPNTDYGQFRKRSFIEEAKRRFAADSVSVGKLSLWQRTIGSKLGISLSNEQFKKVYDLIQKQLNHVSVDAYDAIEQAPDLLGRMETWKDYARDFKRLNPVEFRKINADRKAAAKALFEGTLTEKVWTDKELAIKFSLTPEQITIYRQSHDVVRKSLENLAKSEIIRTFMATDAVMWKAVELLINSDADMETVNAELSELVKTRIKNLDTEIDEAEAALKRASKGTPAYADIQESIAKMESEQDKLEESINAAAKVISTHDQLIAKGYIPLMRFGEYTVTIQNKEGDTHYFEMFETEGEAKKAYRDLSDELPEGGTIAIGTMSNERFRQFEGLTPETIALFAKETGMDNDPAYQDYLKLVVSNRSPLKRHIHRKGIAGFNQDLQRVLASFVMSNARASSRNIYSGMVQEAIGSIDKKNGSLIDDAVNLNNFVNSPAEHFATFRNLIFLWNLGLSVMFGLMNLTQPIMMTLPMLSTRISPAKAASILIKALPAAMSATLQNKAPSGYEREYARAVREGHVDPQNTWLLQGAERGTSGMASSGWQMFSHAMGSIAQITESMNRKTTLIAALEAAKAIGPEGLKKMGFDSLYDYAVDLISQTQGVYNKGNRSNWAQSKLGSVLLVFKSYSVNYVELLWRMSKDQDDPLRKGFLLALMMLWAAAGAFGLPFGQDLKDIVEATAGWGGKPLNLEREVRDALGNVPAEVLLYGASALPGVRMDVAGKMSMGNQVPGTSLLNPYASDTNKSRQLQEVFGAAGGLTQKFFDSIQLMGKGDYWEAIQNALPRSVTSAFKAEQMHRTGQYTNRLDELGSKVADVTAADVFIKALDAQPAVVAREQRIRGMELQDIAIQKAVEADFVKELRQAHEAGDTQKVAEIKADIAEWNKDNPTYRVVINFGRQVIMPGRKNQRDWIDRAGVPREMKFKLRQDRAEQ